MNSGIYRIRNLVNGKCYIGSAFNFERRFILHRHFLRNQKHNPKLQRAWNKYGEDAFVFEIIEYHPKEGIYPREEFYIAEYNSFHKGYNCTQVGVGGGPCSEAAKKKMSVSAIRVAADPEERKRRSERAKRQHAEGKLGKATYKNGGADPAKISAGLKQSAKFKAAYDAKVRVLQTPEEMTRRASFRDLDKVRAQLDKARLMRGKKDAISK